MFSRLKKQKAAPMKDEDVIKQVVQAPAEPSLPVLPQKKAEKVSCWGAMFGARRAVSPSEAELKDSHKIAEEANTANLLLAEENTKLTEVEKLTPIPAVMTEEAEKADTVEDIPLEKDMDKKDEPTETE